MKTIRFNVSIVCDYDNGTDARQMIKDELFELFQGVIGDGEIIIE